MNERNRAFEKGEEALSSGAPHITDRFHALQRKVNEREVEHGHDLDSLVPILASTSANLRSHCRSAVQCVSDWFVDCNTHRFRTFFSKRNRSKEDERHVKLVDQLQTLEAALNDFRTVERVKLIKPYEKFFDPRTKKLRKESNMFATKYVTYITFYYFL